VPIAFTYRPKKAIAAITFFASQNLPELTKGKIDKLLFLADKLHLVRYGRTVTGDWYAALRNGPVPSRTDNLLDALEDGIHGYPELSELAEHIDLDRRFEYPRIVGRGPSAIITEQLSESDIEALNRIVELFGHRTFFELRAITHQSPAWEKAWESRGSANSAEMDFEDFFEEDDQALSGVKQQALENSALRSAFPDAGWE
jgi:uncharacterized phage-associated protein